jgi:HK97 family phage major capsid protein
MKTLHQHRDFAAFLARLSAIGSYEKRNAPDLAGTLDAITNGLDQFKTSQTEEMQSLKKSVEKLETKLARPGAGAGQAESMSNMDPVIQLKNASGKSIPVYGSKQRLGDSSKASPEEFSIGEFVRDAMVGSRKAASGPALVPVGLSGAIIDRVRRQTVIVEAGALTIALEGPEVIARLTADPTVYQHTESATDISESDILAVPVSLNPKLLAAIIPLTVEPDRCLCGKAG